MYFISDKDIEKQELAFECKTLVTGLWCEHAFLRNWSIIHIFREPLMSTYGAAALLAFDKRLFQEH